MSGKPGCNEAAKRYARQGPDGMVKAGLPEPQRPNCNLSGREWRMASDVESRQTVPYSLEGEASTCEETKEIPGCSPRSFPRWRGEGKQVGSSYRSTEALRESWAVYNGPNKDAKRAPKPS